MHIIHSFACTSTHKIKGHGTHCHDVFRDTLIQKFIWPIQKNKNQIKSWQKGCTHFQVLIHSLRTAATKFHVTSKINQQGNILWYKIWTLFYKLVNFVITYAIPKIYTSDGVQEEQTVFDQWSGSFDRQLDKTINQLQEIS